MRSVTWTSEAVEMKQDDRVDFRITFGPEGVEPGRKLFQEIGQEYCRTGEPPHQLELEVADYGAKFWCVAFGICDQCQHAAPTRRDGGSDYSCADCHSE